MIAGVGTDIAAVARLGQLYARHGERALEKLLAPAEMADFARASDPARFLAKRFAAKEACSKALGTGLRRGVFWRDMGVINQRGGRPTMALTGGALARLQEMTPAAMSPQIDLTLTDEYPMAQAIVIISAVPQT